VEFASAKDDLATPPFGAATDRRFSADAGGAP
jgi:hypothetical protein